MRTLTCLLASLLLSAASAPASTFSVTNAGATFTITRSGDTSAAETVLYRTIPLSAYPGQHYTAKSDTLVFAPGQTTTNLVVSERSPSSPFNYQVVSSRAYRLQILDPVGTNLVYCLRSRSVGSAVGSSLFAQKSATIDTAAFTVTDGGYHQTGNPHTFNVSSFYDSDQRSYLSYVSAQLHATLEFQSKEVEDGYQYLQVLVDNTTGYDSKNDADKGDPGTPTLSSYMAGFEMNTGSADTTYRTYSFPVTSVGSDEGASNPWGYSSDGKYPLSKQKFNTNCRASDGKIVVSNGFSTLSVRFDASGSNNDNWMAKNLVAKFTAHESTKPYIRSGTVVAPGPYRHGTEFYVSVPFSEIVTTSGTPKLHTSWGDLSCLSTSDSNVLTFKGTIAADVDTPLVIRCISGTVTDLAGNALTGTNVNANLSCTVGYPWPGAGTEQDAYVITTAAQLDYLAARVNAGTWFTNTCFELGADIAYSHAATDWDTITSSGDCENNFTPIGGHGHSFRGTFDGKGHTVSGIRVFKEDNDDTDHSDESLGLFGFVSDGTVKNVFLRDANIHGKRNLGGIVGYLSGGVVTNCLLYNVRVSTGSTRFNVYVDVGYNSGTIDGNRYRDCCIGQKPAQASGELINVRQDNLFAVAPADDVAAAFASGESAAIDGTNYYTAGSAFALSYTGAVPANWSVVYAATGGAAVNGATLTLASADTTVTASVVPPAAYAAHWQAGADHDGTSAKPYVITTPAGLELLSAEVNAGTGFSGTYFRLGADIDMGTVATFDPIGRYNSKPFAGNFNGGGYAIRNLTVNIADGTCAGLFGRVDGSVANLTLGDATITGYNFTGGIVGSLYASDATLDNCHVVRSVITCANQLPTVGAIVGTLHGTAAGCTYHSTIVRAPNDTGDHFQADGDAFNIGTGTYYAPSRFRGDISGAAFDPSCLLLPTNAPSLRADLIAAYADPAAHTAYGGAAPDLSGLVVTSGVTRLYAVTNAAPAGLSVSGTDVVLAGLGRSYFAPGDAVALVAPAGYAIAAASYTDASGAHDIEPAAAFAYSFPMPASDVTVAATLATLSGYCGRADANGGQNVAWSFDLATGALAVTTNAAAVGTDFSMADYAWADRDATPWATLRPYVRSVTIAPGVTSVGDYAFDGCTALAALSIGGDVARIGEGTFENCTALEAVFIPGSVASIGFSSFSGCTALATVTGGANVTRIGGYAFGSLGWSNDNTTPWLRAQPAGVVYLGKVAIAFQSGGGTAVEIAPGTVSIAEETFMFAPVTSVVIPESVVHIGTSAFFSCNALRAVYLLSAAPPALDDPDDLFADEFGEPISDQLFYVRGTAYADAWSGVWGWMGNNPAWTDANRIVIGTVSCADGITASGTPAVTYGGTNYYAAGTAIALAGEPPVPDPVPAGYTDQLAGYAVNGLPVGVSFAMPERDVTVTPRWAVVDFETGHAGTEQDPYVIYNKDQLDLLAARVNGGKIYNGKFIRLGADIAYDPTALDENGENYTAIGGYHDGGSKSFRGTFDGDGHTVRGIRINKTGDSNADSYQGLFGEVDNGTIRNVTLANSVFGGFYYLGGIVGYQYNGAIVNCRVESDVIIKAGAGGAYSHGGIAGTVAGIGNLLGCFSAATVTDDQNSGSRYYGGIVGTNKDKGAVKDCFVLCGTVSAYSDSGAIAGDKYNLASFTNNYYAACTVNGTTNATNVGCGYPAGDIDGARYAHTITLGPGVRIVGEETVYSNSCLTAIGTSALRYTGGGTNVIYSGAGQTVALAYDGVVPEGYAFVGFVVNGAAIDGDSFAMPDADVTVRADIAAIPWTGGGTAEDPYLIQYPSQLDLLAANVNGGVTNYAGAFFLQVADLVYDSTTNNYTPVGYGVFAFGGTYDGGGHIVSGINVTWTDGFDSNNGIGLFGGVNSGTVRNVTVADSVFVGNGEAGGVAGYVVEAVVSNCCVEGSVVIGTGAVQTYCHGGIVGGGTSSAIVGCFSAAAVTSNAGDEFFGGIAGLFYGGRIENCLYGGTVQSAGITGAILGYAFVSMPVLCNNLYTADGLPGGFNGNDTDGARRAHTITLGERVRIVGEETVYDASGLAAIGTSALRYTGGGTNVIYGGAGETVTLVYDGVPPEGYAFVGFVVNGVAVDGESFEMPAAAVTVAAEIITDWEALNRRLAAGGTVTLDKDYTATAEDTYLTVPEGVAVTLDLNGHILDRNLAAATNLGCVIEVRGSLAVTDGAPAATHTGALEGIPGGIVTGGNTTGDGGGVHVNGSAAIFTLSGGTIADNAAQHGGGVYVYKGSFTLSGGTITNNTAKYGGGVYVGNGSFTLSGGAVSENDASSYGGGVYVNGGTATLSGGAVSGNAANGGGGVYMYSGTVALSGGAVSGNAARYGGGVYLYRGTATLSGGAVSENTASSYGGGVYVANYSSTLFQIGGGPVVSGNAVGGEPNNVHLESGKHIDVTEELTASARLGVTAADGPGVFTAGLSGNGGAENFFSDDPVWRVRVTSGGEAELFVPDAFYAVVIGENAHGAVTASVNDSVVVRAVAGDTVVLVGDPAEGYGLRSVVVTNASGVAVATIPGTGGNAGGFVFEMPAASVGVEATFETVYPVAIAPDILHGTVAADRDAAFAGDVVTVTLAPDEGYALGSLSVADANGDPVWLLSQDGPEAQFEMPVGGAVVSARFAACVPASYVDENGEERTAQAIPLEDWMTRLTEGFYVVTGEVSCASGVEMRGDVTLILADGCALRFGTPEAPLDGIAIEAGGSSLDIYGQAGGTGRLEIYNANGCGIYVVDGYAQHGGCVLVRTSGSHDCIYTDGSVVLDGGSLDVESESGYGIYADGNIDILGGRLNASGEGLYTDSITLGHRNPTDSIYAAHYRCDDPRSRVRINGAQALTDGTNVYTGWVEPVEIAGKTLTPAYGVDIFISISGWQGRVTAGKDYFAAGETVTLAFDADPGYAPVALTATDVAGNPVAVTNNAFTMPARYVTVTATFGPVAFPSYLTGADYVVTNNYLAWAGKYGSDTSGAYESCFLLDLPPWTAFPEGAALLKIVELGTTNIPTAMSDLGYIAMRMGYEGEELPCRRLVLASDVAQLKRREGFDTPFEACNGYLVLRIGGDLAAPLDEWLAMSWLVEFEDGRGEIVFPELFMEGIRGNLERAAGRPLGGLFLRPCISPVASLEWISNIGILIEGP